MAEPRIKLPLTRAELDGLKCNCGRCKDELLFLKAACHKDAASEVVYNQRTGHLTISCCECGKEVVKVLVARNLIEV